MDAVLECIKELRDECFSLKQLQQMVGSAQVKA
jgi:hypothetical protein